jgi:hypothetical protein
MTLPIGRFWLLKVLLDLKVQLEIQVLRVLKGP